MNDQTKQWYSEFRAVGMPAEHAIRNARIMYKAGNREDIRLRLEPEFENYFDVYGLPDTEKEKQDIQRYIDMWGCYIVISECKCPVCHNWHLVDSVGMCIYENPLDPTENWYVPDLLSGALEQIKARD